MYDNNSNPLIHWFENLEENCVRLIHEKSDTWFQNALEKSDVESAFNSIIRIYKSGKYYLVRSNIKSLNITNEPAVKIYNENEISINYQDVKNEHFLLSILEIQGIKFTNRNFQIEIELKQIMVLDNEPIFDNCVIKIAKKNNSLENKVPIESVPLESLPLEENKIDSSLNSSLSVLNDNLFLEKEKEVKEIEKSNSDSITNSNELNDSLDLIIEELDGGEKEDLKEINFDLPLENEINSTESITLKKPNQVYFELYKNARTKAKEAKKNLILAYLEAKNIKKTYMLDNLSENSDSDLDAEIEDTSEGELEGL
jgi:hypothetical protein